MYSETRNGDVGGLERNSRSSFGGKTWVLSGFEIMAIAF
jgi:hypothetical protein